MYIIDGGRGEASRVGGRGIKWGSILTCLLRSSRGGLRRMRVVLNTNISSAGRLRCIAIQNATSITKNVFAPLVVDLMLRLGTFSWNHRHVSLHRDRVTYHQVF